MASFIESFSLLNIPHLLTFSPLKRVQYSLAILFLYDDIFGKTYTPLLLDCATDFCDCILMTLFNIYGLTYFLCFIITTYPSPHNSILSLFRVKLIWIFCFCFQSLLFFFTVSSSIPSRFIGINPFTVKLYESNFMELFSLV